MVTPVVRRQAVVHLCEVHGLSQRRACRVLQVDRSMVRYWSVRVDDTELRDAIKRVSRERRRFGYRRIHVMIEREGHMVNHKKLRRIYTEEKLQVRRRGGRKRALGTRKPMVLPDGSNQRWSLDFVSDAFTDGRRFRILTVVDDFTRENLALIADTSLSASASRGSWIGLLQNGACRVRLFQTTAPSLPAWPFCGGPEYRDRLALYRSRKANPKRIYRKLQRKAARRVLK